MNERKPNNLSLGKFIQKERLARQMTTTEIAQAISVSERVYSHYEEGSVSIYIEHLVALSPILKIDLQLFFEAYLNPEK